MAGKKYASKRETAFGVATGGLAVDGEDNLYIGGRTVAKVSSSGKTLLGDTSQDKKDNKKCTVRSVANVMALKRALYSLGLRSIRVAARSISAERVSGDSDSEETETTVGASSLTAAPIERFGAGHIPGVNTPFIGGLAVDASTGGICN